MYRLLIGQRSYSSWSLRGYLSFALFDIPVTIQDAVIYGPDFAEQVAEFGGGSTVPVAATIDGVILRDSLSIAWHIADQYAHKGVMPTHPQKRAEAQNLIADMHAGYSALRGDCPMNLRNAWDGFHPSAAVLQDLAQLDARLGAALAASGGPFLFGTPTLVDAFYAPVAIRIAGYGLPVGDLLRAYVNAILALPAVQSWRAEGLARDAEVAFYDKAPLHRLPFHNRI